MKSALPTSKQLPDVIARHREVTRGFEYFSSMRRSIRFTPMSKIEGFVLMEGKNKNGGLGELKKYGRYYFVAAADHGDFGTRFHVLQYLENGAQIVGFAGRYWQQDNRCIDVLASAEGSGLDKAWDRYLKIETPLRPRRYGSSAMRRTPAAYLVQETPIPLYMDKEKNYRVMCA